MTADISITDSGDFRARLSGRRFLITGASGFIGSHLCRRLYESGANVHGISRTPRHSENGGARWWHVDVTDQVAVANIMAVLKPDVVVHLAACVTGRRELEVVLPTLRDNLVSAVNVLTAAAATGCGRVVLAGSLEEPDLEQGGEPIPCSPYAASKWSASAYGRMFYQLYNLPVVIARLFMVYGPAQHDLQKLIPYVTTSLLQGTPTKLTDGSRPVDWIYVADAVDGLLAVCQTPSVEGHTIDIGSGSLVPVRAVVEKIAELAASPVKPLFGALPSRSHERIRTADVHRTFQQVGWKAKVSLDQGLAETVHWYRSHGFQAQAETKENGQ